MASTKRGSILPSFRDEIPPESIQSCFLAAKSMMPPYHNKPPTMQIKRDSSPCPSWRVHAADQQWVMRPDEAIAFWDGETKSFGDGLMLIRCGGHFDGGTVLHWQTNRS